MGYDSAAWVVDATEDEMVNRPAVYNASLMIFLNRMVRHLDLTKLPDPKGKITLLDIRPLCGGICLEYRRHKPPRNFDGFSNYVVERFERMAGKRRW
jgi:hypothetical protein